MKHFKNFGKVSKSAISIPDSEPDIFTADIIDENNNRVDIKNTESFEQTLAYHHVKKDDIVLELGGRYGSVSYMINKKLSCKTNQVVVEPDERVWNALERNKKVNECEFNIVKGFISSKKLGLTCLERFNGYGATFIENPDTQIPSFTLEEVKETYKLNFNVLIADCEGFLETFFDENPTFYDGLRMIIFEADHPYKCDYDKIRTELKQKGFVELLGGF